MAVNKPQYLLTLLSICRAISYFCAGLNYVLISISFLNTPVFITVYPVKKFETLHGIWYAKLARRVLSFLIRTRARKDVLKLIAFNIPVPRNSGCIIVTCHTPWKRILSYWCLENKFALLIGGGKWADDRRFIQRKGASITELRTLVKFLQLGGRVITNGDVFNNSYNCPVKFLGQDHNASLFSERLAALAGVPIITLVPKLSDTTIEFTAGPQFLTEDRKSKSTTITSQIISFFEREIQLNPSIWSNYVH